MVPEVMLRDAPQFVELAIAGIEITQQDHVVFIAAVVPDDSHHVVQDIDLGGNFIRVGVDIDEREREGALRRHAADTERADQGRSVQEVVRVAHAVAGKAVDLDASSPGSVSRDKA